MGCAASSGQQAAQPIPVPHDSVPDEDYLEEYMTSPSEEYLDYDSDQYVCELPESDVPPAIRPSSPVSDDDYQIMHRANSISFRLAHRKTSLQPTARARLEKVRRCLPRELSAELKEEAAGLVAAKESGEDLLVKADYVLRLTNSNKWKSGSANVVWSRVWLELQTTRLGFRNEKGTPFVSTMLMPDLSMCSQEELESAILRGMRMTSQELKLHCTFEMDSAEVINNCHDFCIQFCVYGNSTDDYVLSFPSQERQLEWLRLLSAVSEVPVTSYAL